MYNLQPVHCSGHAGNRHIIFVAPGVLWHLCAACLTCPGTPVQSRCKKQPRSLYREAPAKGRGSPVLQVPLTWVPLSKLVKNGFALRCAGQEASRRNQFILQDEGDEDMGNNMFMGGLSSSSASSARQTPEDEKPLGRLGGGKLGVSTNDGLNRKDGSAFLCCQALFPACISPRNVGNFQELSGGFGNLGVFTDKL